MQVGLGPFARQGLEDRLGPDLQAGVEVALLYFLGKERSNRSLPPFPSFLQNEHFEDPVALFDLDVGPEVEGMLSGEAERRQITVDRLIAHCVFIYLAELDRVEAQADHEGGEVPK
jgi:hypothetical protein